MLSLEHLIHAPHRCLRRSREQNNADKPGTFAIMAGLLHFVLLAGVPAVVLVPAYHRLETSCLVVRPTNRLM